MSSYISIADAMNTTMKAKLSPDILDRGELKKLITEILLEDPGGEIVKISENYLIQCLIDAINDPQNNPILFGFFESLRTNIRYETESMIEDKLRKLEPEKLNRLRDYVQYLSCEIGRILEEDGKGRSIISYWAN